MNMPKILVFALVCSHKFDLTILRRNNKDPFVPIKKMISYCKFGNFCENFIFKNSVRTHICHLENL